MLVITSWRKKNLCFQKINHDIQNGLGEKNAHINWYRIVKEYIPLGWPLAS